MKQISTGAGLLGLGVCMVATAFIATQRGGEAFAQAGGGERRIVYTNVLAQDSGTLVAYRIWSDNTIDVRNLGCFGSGSLKCSSLMGPISFGYPKFIAPAYAPPPDCFEGGPPQPADCQLGWLTVDNGTTTVLHADVDQSRMVDAGDISAVLVQFGRETGDPPPPIDCTINAPR